MIIRPELVAQALRDLPDEFTSHDVIEHPSVMRAHPNVDRSQFAIALSNMAHEVGIEKVDRRSRGAQVWRKRGAAQCNEPNEIRPPVRTGHWRSLQLLEATADVRLFLDRYEAELGSPVYLRPAERGLTVVPLAPTSPKLVGIGREVTSSSGLSVDPIELATAVASWRVEAPRAEVKPEEQFSISMMSAALRSRLTLPLDGVLFVCNEWRLPSGQRVDLVGVRPEDRRLVVMELKRKDDLLPSARRQGTAYAEQVAAAGDELLAFFGRLARAMGGLYGAPALHEDFEIDGLPPLVAVGSAESRRLSWCVEG